MIGCPNNSDIEPWHYAQSIPIHSSRIDILYLEALVTHGVRPVQDTCTYIGHPTERKPRCGKYIPTMYYAYANSILAMIIPRVKAKFSTIIVARLNSRSIYLRIQLDFLSSALWLKIFTHTTPHTLLGSQKIMRMML